MILRFNEFIERAQFYDELTPVEGRITDLDVIHKEIRIGNDTYKLLDSSLTLALRRLGLTGTVKDFTRNNGIKDVEFIEKAVRRKIDVWNVRPSMILTDGTYAYTVMSTKYVRVKHEDVISEIGRFVDIENYFDEDRSFITEKNMYMFLKGLDEFEIPNDSNFLFGVMVRNSETGWGALGLAQFLERLVCENGLTSKIASMTVKKAHIGEIRSFYEAKLPKILNPMPVINVLNKAVQRGEIVDNVENLSMFLGRVGIRKEHHEGIRKAFAQEAGLGLTPYGISNAITRYNDHIYRTKSGFDMEQYYSLATIAMEVLYV